MIAYALTRPFCVAFLKGKAAARCGIPLSANPYRDLRDNGRPTWALSWSRAWAAGWQAATEGKGKA